MLNEIGQEKCRYFLVEMGEDAEIERRMMFKEW